MNEHQAREEICRIGQSLFARGYVHASAGNISVRLDDGFLITPTDACLGFLDPARLARLDAPMQWDAHAHRVEVVVRGSMEEVGRHLGVAYGDLADLGDGRVRYATGVDDPAEAAALLAWLPFDFVIEEDEAVVAAVAALARRLGEAAREHLRGERQGLAP